MRLLDLHNGWNRFVGSFPSKEGKKCSFEQTTRLTVKFICTEESQQQYYYG